MSTNSHEDANGCIWQMVTYLTLILVVMLLAYYGHILLVSLLFIH